MKSAKTLRRELAEARGILARQGPNRPVDLELQRLRVLVATLRWALEKGNGRWSRPLDVYSSPRRRHWEGS